jgi:hypothetical protein
MTPNQQPGVSGPPNDSPAGTIVPGIALRAPKAGHLVRGRDLAQLFMAMNAALKLEVTRDIADQDFDGNYYNSAQVAWSDGKLIISLKDAPPGSGSGGGGGGNAGLQTGRFQITNLSYIYGDYLIAADIDGRFGSPGGLFRIAKNWRLRNSITALTIDGTAFTYTYTTTVERSVYIIGPTFLAYQRISPRYVINDWIYATQVANTGINGGMTNEADVLSATPGIDLVNWLDMNIDGRAWADNYDQTAP